MLNRGNTRPIPIGGQDPEQKKDGEKKMMDYELYESATRDGFEIILLKKGVSKEAIINEVSPSGNSLLHAAASSGKEGATLLLASQFPELITAKNFQDDTALHVAAGAGKLNTLKILIDNGSKIELLKMRNRKGNTPLHVAVINGHQEVVHYLLSHDPQLAYCGDLDEGIEEGKSPLYIAAQNDNIQILDLLLQAIARDDNSLARLQGKSPAHAAIEKENIGILKQIADKKPELLRAKEKGENNALHLASDLGFLDGVKLLVKKCSDCVIEKNKEGLNPIHVACKKGNVEVVEELLKQWPEPNEFLTEKGENILHVAAQHGQDKVIKFINGDQKLGQLLNEKDNDGNTPLHLATKHGCCLAAYVIVTNEKADKTIVNHQNLTPYAEAKKRSKQLEFNMKKSTSPAKDKHQDPKATNQRRNMEFQDLYGLMMTFSVLYIHGRPERSKDNKYLRDKGKPMSKEEIRSRTEFLLVVAVLVAGAAFNGACQVPGGNNSGNNSESILYHFYYLGTLLALLLSVWAAIIICYWVQLFNVKIATQAVWLASVLVGSSINFMCLAFLIALTIDTQVLWRNFFVVSAILAFIFPLFSFAFLIPPIANKIVEKYFSPYVYYLMFRVYFLDHMILDRLRCR